MTNMPAAIADFASRQAERAAQAHAELQHLKQAVIPPLREAGIVTVEVHFEGYGDSGAVDSCTCFDTAGHEVPCPETMIEEPEKSPDAPTPHRQVTLCSALENLTYLALERHHPGWEDNDGELVIDVAEAGFTLDCSVRYTACNDHSTEL